MTLRIHTWTLVAALLTLISVNTRADTPLTTVRVAAGLSDPLFAGSPPADLARVFIVEQTGAIKILKAGALLPTPFLDISAKIIAGGEQGLLGLAFHPNYASNGYVFVNYTRVSDAATVVARYHASANPDVADAGSELVILTIPQPYSNHNGGMLAFGPDDGFLYLGMGDGGSGGDPDHRAQNGGELLGKMLRIDIDHGSPYENPPSNPFFGPGDPLDEIWALGMRNPWRWSFDRLTGDLYVGDVGQGTTEEIDFQPASSAGGENYGWPCMEGSDCTGNIDCTCMDAKLSLPIHEYGHGAGCAVTGGYVYRGCAVADLQGTYFFSDYCSATIWSLRYDGTTVSDLRDRTAELAPVGLSIAWVASFGEDALGEMYIVDQGGGELFKIVPAAPVAAWSNYGAGWPGTNGVPAFTASGDPVICAALDLVLGNSLGQATLGGILVGAAATATTTIYDGTLLVVPSLFVPVALPAQPSITLPVTIPCDAALCGVSTYLQALEYDAGASQGVSFTAGLKITTGPQG